jgi:hypothetical protein
VGGLAELYNMYVQIGPFRKMHLPASVFVCVCVCVCVCARARFSSSRMDVQSNTLKTFMFEKVICGCICGGHALTAEMLRQALLGFVLIFVHVVCHIRQAIKSLKQFSAAVLGCSSECGWILFILPGMLLCGGLSWQLLG